MPNILLLLARSFLFSVFTFSSLIFPLSIAQQQFEASPVQAQASLQFHNFFFYIHPSLVTDMSEAKLYLSKYVADLNTLLAKNTIRRLSFNPDQNIILTSTSPASGWCCTGGASIPQNNFAIWAHVSPINSGQTISNGGFMSMHNDGSGVIAGIRWTKIYDPDALDTYYKNDDYWRQLHAMAHEIGHIFGAAYGEYYTLAVVNDSTGTAPIQNIKLGNGMNDPYWSQHTDMWFDPMLSNVMHSAAINPLPVTREAALALEQFSPLTAAIMNMSYRHLPSNVRLPNMDNVKIKVVDAANGLPIDGARVKMWKVTDPDNVADPLVLNTFVDQMGQVQFDWVTGTASIHTNMEFLRLIKVYRPGYVTAVKYFSVFDAERVKILEGKNELVISVPMEIDPAVSDTQAPTGAFTAPSPAVSTVSGTVSVAVAATDDVAVGSVTFAVDGVTAMVDTEAPYTFAMNTKSYAGSSHVLSATIRDYFGHSTMISRNLIFINGPTISKRVVTPLKNGSVLFTWNTDEAANSIIIYEKVPFSKNTLSDHFGTKVTDSSFVTRHSMILSGLQRNTLYRYIIISTDKKGSVSMTKTATFRTSP